MRQHEITRPGRIVGKRNKFGLLGLKKYMVSVEFDEPFNKATGEKSCEFQVNSAFYHDTVIGARVKGIFDQVPEGLKPVACIV